jgi:hypothetical protein
MIVVTRPPSTIISVDQKSNRVSVNQTLSIVGLNNVAVNNPTTDDTLVYAAGHWVNAPSKTENFEFVQPSNSAVWEILHNLNKRPSVTVVDSGGATVEGDIAYVDANRLIITFSDPIQGTAFLN